MSHASIGGGGSGLRPDPTTVAQDVGQGLFSALDWGILRYSTVSAHSPQSNWRRVL